MLRQSNLLVSYVSGDAERAKLSLSHNGKGAGHARSTDWHISCIAESVHLNMPEI